MLSGAAYGGKVRQLSDMENDSGNGHFFVFVDTERFIDSTKLASMVDDYKKVVKSCGKDRGVYLPGELGDLKTKGHKEYIELSDKQISEINNTAESCKIAARLEAWDEK